MGGTALSLRPQTDIAVRWITLRGKFKVYWLDFSLHFGSCCLLHFFRKFGTKLASYYKPVKKRSIVRRTVGTVFGELKVLLSSITKQFAELSEVCSANQQFAQLRNGLKMMCASFVIWPTYVDLRQLSLIMTHAQSSQLYVFVCLHVEPVSKDYVRSWIKMVVSYACEHLCRRVWLKYATGWVGGWVGGSLLLRMYL